MSNSMEGRVVLITGASQGGTGRSTAVRFASEGATVAVTARSEEGLRETVAAVEAVGGRCVMFPADLADPNGDVRTLVERTESELGPLDVLVNNAATAQLKPLEEWSYDDLQEIQQVNVWSPVMLMQQALPGMRARGRGWILNLTSSSAELPPGPPFGTMASDGYSAYGATKAALNRITVAVAAETENTGVLVNALTPESSIASPRTLAGGIVDKVILATGETDTSFIHEPVECMAEAALVLCTGTFTGRIAYSLQFLVELDRPVHTLDGTELLSGSQPADLVAKIRKQIDFQLHNGGPDIRGFNRTSTPLPGALL